MIVAIHQPNFFPWLGYFSKIVTCDKFIFLDDVQIPKTGGTWSNRVKMLVNGEGKWVTAPIVRDYHGVRAINEISFDARNPWRDKISKTLEANYRRSPFFNEAMNLIAPILFNPQENIAIYNMDAVRSIAAIWDIPQDKFVLSSSLPCELSSNERLIHLTKGIGGDVYMCGGGADSYQDEAAFSSAGIRLHRQNFTHPQYPQRGSADFVPGLSIVDSLMNVGIDGVRELLS